MDISFSDPVNGARCGISQLTISTININNLIPTNNKYFYYSQQVASVHYNYIIMYGDIPIILRSDIIDLFNDFFTDKSSTNKLYFRNMSTSSSDKIIPGSDGTNKHVYIKSGGLGIGTTSITDNDLNVHGTTTLNNNVTMNSDLDVSGSATFQGETQFDDATTGISYGDLSNRPTIPSANTLSYSTSTIDGNGYIWVMPTQFMPNDDNSYFNAAIVDNGAQARVMTSSLELYANIPIPTGYKVTHFRLNGTSSVAVSIYYSDVTTATATSAQVTTLYTNADNSVNPSSGIAASSSGRYIILKWNPTSTSHRLYGARLTITKV